MRRFPNVLLQWEDFASVDAERILERYRDQLCTFNDDIQGTAAVTTGTILAAVDAAGGKLTEQRIRDAGCRLGGFWDHEQLIRAMIQRRNGRRRGPQTLLRHRSSWAAARSRTDLDANNRQLAQPQSNLSSWDCDVSGPVAFTDVVRNARPTVLVGATGQHGAFGESVIREMAKHTEHPIVFPLSNPTSRVEATPSDCWTGPTAKP